MPPLKPDRDKNFGGSLVFDFGQSWRHVKTIYMGQTILSLLNTRLYNNNECITFLTFWRQTTPSLWWLTLTLTLTMWNYSVAMATLKKKTNLLSIIKLLSVTYHIKSVIWQTTFLSNKGIISLMFWPSSDKFPHTYKTPWNSENLDKMTVKLSPLLIAKATYPSPRDLSMRKNEWFRSWTSAIKHCVHKS